MDHPVRQVHEGQEELAAPVGPPSDGTPPGVPEGLLPRATADAVAIGIERLELDRLGRPRGYPDDLIDEGPLRYVADIVIEALHTPGHTEGSTCFYVPAENVLFSGDVLFRGNVGRVDLPGGDARAMETSLARVAALPPATLVYPGHGPQTSIGAELRWLRGFRFD